MKFSKYHSLGNDFIILDHLADGWDIDSYPDWKKQVQALCNRHTGIGADGILIIRKNKLTEVLIFNSNGNQAQTCLNGLRCCTHYLASIHGYSDRFPLLMGTTNYQCSLSRNEDGTIDVITTHIPTAHYQGTTSCNTQNKTWLGHVVDVGNPHFIINSPVSHCELIDYGPALESHPHFPQKTNVEWVWHDPKHPAQKDGVRIFHLRVYERDCGITQACSSGAAATTLMLYKTGQIKPQEIITIAMSGGGVFCYIDEAGAITLGAQAHHVFEGSL